MALIMAYFTRFALNKEFVQFIILGFLYENEEKKLIKKKKKLLKIYDKLFLLINKWKYILIAFRWNLHTSDPCDNIS